jgi:hypothetical protein
MTFRFEKENDIFILYWKVLNGAGGYEPGEIEIEQMKILSEKEWTEFTVLIKKADFWNMELGRKTIGFDGSEWIMEGVNQTDYRVVSVWTPTYQPKYLLRSFHLPRSEVDLTIKNK